jgi:NodT family efflux transporter outer membrane factor (OMF) lipoprotein
MRNAHATHILVALLPITCALSACTVGPDYAPPKPDVPAGFAGASPAASGDVELARWWTGFDDPTLDALVARALRDNLDLQTAASRIREARQQEVVAGAVAWPTLTANPGVTHTTLSGNAISLGSLGTLTAGAANGGASSSTGAPSLGLAGTSFNTYQLGLTASWELDLFGRTRRSVEAAHDTAEATVWNARDTQVALIGEVADAYLALRAAQRRLAIAQRDLARQRGLLDLVRARATSGLATTLDVRQQQTSVAETESGLPPLMADVAVQRHALDVLLGTVPEADLDLAANEALPAPPAIPIGLPADLLRRRPDIRAAERQLAAATANVGVAVADFYPDITLTASPALVSTMLSNLLTWGSRNLTAGASVSWNLFDGGKVKANVAVMDERQKQALLAYRKTVLTALQDVEDALTHCAADRARQQALAVQTDSARDADDLARVQFRSGLVPFSTVLTTEAALLTAEDTAAQTDEAAAQDVVALYKALGGGWDAAAPAQAAMR